MFFVKILHRPTFEENQIYEFDNLSAISQHPKYDQNRQTVLYLHGYLEAPQNESIHLIVDSYLTRNDHNVIVLDYFELVDGNYVLSAVPNAIAVSCENKIRFDKKLIFS